MWRIWQFWRRSSVKLSWCISSIFSFQLWQKLSFDDDDESIDDVTSAEPDVISDRLLGYKLRQATMFGHLTDYRRRIEELDVVVCSLFVLLYWTHLSLTHTAYVHARSHAWTCVYVLIEHVDFYDCTLTDCSHVRARTCLYAQICARFVRGVAWFLLQLQFTQYRAVSRSIRIVSIILEYCVQLQRHASTDVHARARTTYVHVRGRTCARVVLHASLLSLSLSLD